MKRLTFGYAAASMDPLCALECGILAEKSGFDTFWVPDHFIDINGDRLEPWTVLSAVAARTRKIRLGSAVTDTQRNHPARTAHLVTCLDVISRGRAILGIGAGEAMNTVPFGLPWEPPQERVARLSETIQVIRLLWASSREEPVSFTGQYYRLENAFLTQSPRQKPGPPIYVGAFASKAGLEVVGHLADGWLPWFNTADTFRKRWSVIKEAAQSRGRSLDEIEPATHIMMAFPRNAAEKRDALLAAKAFLLTEKKVLMALEKEVSLPVLHYQNLVASKDYVAKIMEAAKALPDHVVHEVMSIGGIDELKEKIDDLRRVGVRHFAIADLLAPKNQRRTLQMLRKVIKQYR
jgi:phthiodiolone/phenolphthiodiolone dimycocerosates ketoreductase